MELTDEIIFKIDDLLFDWAFLTVTLGQMAHNKEKIPNQYINDDILIEYYNGIKDGKDSLKMREICLPKYIRRELNKNN